jgi:hypothetical protein
VSSDAGLNGRERAVVVLKMTTAGPATATTIILLMVATSATAALLHLPEVYWPDSSTRHNLYGVLLILGLVGSVLATPCALMSFGLCRSAGKRAGAPPRLAAMLGSAVGAVLALGAAAMILPTRLTSPERGIVRLGKGKIEGAAEYLCR